MIERIVRGSAATGGGAISQEDLDFIVSAARERLQGLDPSSSVFSARFEVAALPDSLVGLTESDLGTVLIDDDAARKRFNDMLNLPPPAQE